MSLRDRLPTIVGATVLLGLLALLANGLLDGSWALKSSNVIGLISWAFGIDLGMITAARKLGKEE